MDKETNGIDYATNGAGTTQQRKPYDYGGNPLAHVATNDPELRLAAFGGEFQPGLYRPPNRKFANPAPLGLSAFALTTFVLSLINVQTRGIGSPSLVVAIAYGYGGLVQLLAGMWYVTINAHALSQTINYYLGKWLSVIPLVLLLCPRTVVFGSRSLSS